MEALAGDDPRLDGQYVRIIDATPQPVVLVGVVHDHPASVYRARRTVAALDPGVVALEAPDAVTPVFAAHARDEEAAGGEMTAAVSAAGDADVVGVDAPGQGTLRSLGTVLADERPSVAAVAGTLRTLGRIGAHAARGRLQAAGVPARWLGGEFDRSQSYDCTAADSAVEQAAHEATRLERSTSLLRAFDPPPAMRVLDAVRERQMGRRIASLAASDVVVAVVGCSHLDGVENEIAGV